MIPNIKAKFLQEVSKERDKYVTKSEPDQKKRDELIQATAATVGFVSEIIHHRKEKASRQPPEAHDLPSLNFSSSRDSSQVLEEGPNGSEPTPKDLAAAFLYRHPISSAALPRPSINLTTPVLIPQRRPNTRARGFAPAYAPALSPFNISHQMFLDFIITLNASLEPNPYLNAINLAGFAGEASPEPIVSLMVGIGVEVVTDAIMEAQSRAKSNGFLGKVNEGFFAPRGLFAFVGTWRPNDEKDEQVVDVTLYEHASAPHCEIDFVGRAKSVAAGDAAAKHAWGDLKQQMQRAISPAGGNIATVKSAPLVWASMDDIAAATPSNMLKKKDRFDRAGLWLDDHVDKHAQIRWTQEYPDHPLAASLPKPEFRSRYADPSHAASSGDVVSFLTGGQWHMKEDEKKKEKELRKKREKKSREEEKLKAKEKKLAVREEKAKTKLGELEAKSKSSKEEGAETSLYHDNAEGKTMGKDSNDSNHRISKEVSLRESDSHSQELSEQRKKEEPSNNGIGGLLQDVSDRLNVLSAIMLTWSTESPVSGHRSTSVIS
ncbi:hypothetical protein SVAN01_06723 [Stagonosporopsis vannaccii]|nr:hypothetical protein SVAN01_06723 [Stagonosporopsis vannaccii]